MNTTNIAASVSFSLDRAISFARDAIIGHAAVKANAPGLSEQLWAGLREARSDKFCDSMRDSFDAYIGELSEASGKGSERSREMAKRLSGWKKGSPLAQRLSECRKIAGFCKDNEDRAGEVWALDSLSAALKLVRAAVKASKAPASDGEPDEDTIKLAGRMAIVVEADTEAGAAILLDLLNWLAVASLEDRLYMVTELEKITGSTAYRTP